MVKKALLFLMAGFFLTSLYPAQAITVKEYIEKGYREKKDICSVVKSALKEKYDCRDVVQVSIQEGHTACLVVRCAIEGKGPLEAIIKGALQAGATSDVISRCAIDAGAEPREVAGIMEREGQPGLGYTPPPGAGPAPITAGPPGGGTGGGLLSPASF